MINPMIAAMASDAAKAELQNVRVHGRQAPLRADLAALSLAMTAIAAYKVGDDRESLLQVEEIVRQSQYDETDRATAARILADSLAGGASSDAKAFACRQLWIIGTPAEIPSLAAALKDSVLSDMARYALQNMEYPEVDAALIAALEGTDPQVQIGCSNSLAQRKSPGALDAIKPLKKSKNKEVAAAAKHALARLEGKVVP